jgi:hypothetical protein
VRPEKNSVRGANSGPYAWIGAGRVEGFPRIALFAMRPCAVDCRGWREFTGRAAGRVRCMNAPWKVGIMLFESPEDELIRSAARRLKGRERRLFIAEVTIELCEGSERLSEARFGWGRETARSKFTIHNYLPPSPSFSLLLPPSPSFSLRPRSPAPKDTTTLLFQFPLKLIVAERTAGPLVGADAGSAPKRSSGTGVFLACF